MGDKSRNIPLGQYLDALSREYMVAFVRSKTFPTSGDRRHWSRVAENKRSKIEDISERNNFPNIFDDKPTYIKYFEERTEDNLPAFLKTSEDVENYYSAIGEEVVVKYEGKPLIAELASYSEEQQSCGVLVSGKTISFDIRDVKRFL